MNGKWQSKSQKVAIVFTDIVGSSAVKRVIGGDAAYLARVLYPHHSSVRKLLPQFGGTEIKTTGDGFLMIFEYVQNAITFSMRLQDYFGSDVFSVDLAIQIRVGVHYGEIIVYKDADGMDIAGSAVDYASRVCSLANGGQILTSRETAAVLTPTGYDLVEWPGYIVKGFDGVHSVFQVVWGNRTPESPNGSAQRICDRLLRYIRPPVWRKDVERHGPFIRIRFKSLKYGKTWEYDVSSTVRCAALAEALAEQHFSPFHASFQWFLFDEDGKQFPQDRSLSEAGAKDGSVVCLRMTYSKPPLDSFKLRTPDPLFYADQELKCSANFTRAIVNMERIVGTDPMHINALNNLACVYLEANMRVERAVQLLTQCLRLDPSLEADIYVQDSLGWLAYRQGDYAKAEVYLRNSLKGTPREQDRDGYNITLYHLYFTWKRLGKTQMANLAKEELSSWISEYGQMLLFAKRVRIDDDSYIVPDVPYFSEEWLRHLDLSPAARFQASALA